MNACSSFSYIVPKICIQDVIIQYLHTGPSDFIAFRAVWVCSCLSDSHYVNHDRLRSCWVQHSYSTMSVCSAGKYMQIKLTLLFSVSPHAHSKYKLIYSTVR